VPEDINITQNVNTADWLAAVEMAEIVYTPAGESTAVFTLTNPSGVFASPED
jgi:hypothetical protein